MGFLREIDWKTFIFQGKPRHVTPQIDCLRKTNPVLMVTLHISGISKEIDGKTLNFQSKPRYVTPSNRSSYKNEPCSESFKTHL